MSHPLCPHGNWDTTCPLCNGTWDEKDPHALVPEPTPAPTPRPKTESKPIPHYCVTCGATLTPNDLCPNLVCGGKRKRRCSKSPFSFGAPVLEVMRAKLYDCIDLDTDVPHQLWRLFVDTAGKTDAEISPHVISGGQLPAPRLFLADDFRLVYQVRPLSWGALDAKALRNDVETLKAALTVRLCIGVRNYYEGPAALLPLDLRANKLTIPHGQQFFVQLDTFAAGFTIQTTYRWRVYAQLRGELGMEIR